MLKKSNYSHISFDKLVELKIPILSGRGAENNRLILQTIALQGPMLKYYLHIKTQIGYYSTVSRRVDKLVETGYLAEASRLQTQRGKQTEESAYGLTWKGFLASITIKEIQENTLQVFKINPILAFPEKKTILPIIEELITPLELEILSKAFIEAFLIAIPNFELIQNNPMNILSWVSSIKEDHFKLPEGFKLSKLSKDALELLTIIDKPVIFEVIQKRIVPFIREKTEEARKAYALLRMGSIIGDFIDTLKVEDPPSKKLIEYFKSETSPWLSDPEIQKALEPS